MATDWNDPEINPFGLTHIAEISPRPMRVMVPVEARVLAYFTAKDGRTYLCAYINEEKKREDYEQTEGGFARVIDPAIQFTVARMTDEIIGQRRS
jgi:hypothetical protein